MLITHIKLYESYGFDKEYNVLLVRPRRPQNQADKQPAEEMEHRGTEGCQFTASW